MRITGGIFGGRLLEAPKDRSVRPTSDKVRQAIFNILNSRGLVQDAAILDAFCGTGALGIEALSWGGLCCTFMDKNRGSLELCRRNFAALKTDAKYSLLLKDAVRAGLKPADIAAANLLFLDPPYKQDLIAGCLPALEAGGWLAKGVHVLTESEKSWDPSSMAALRYEIILTRDYGDTRIALAQKTS